MFLLADFVGLPVKVVVVVRTTVKNASSNGRKLFRFRLFGLICSQFQIIHPNGTALQLLFQSQSYLASLWCIFSRHLFTFVHCEPSAELRNYLSAALFLRFKVHLVQVVRF